MIFNSLKSTKLFAFGYIFYYLLFLLVIQFPDFHNIVADLNYNRIVFFNFNDGSSSDILLTSDKSDDDEESEICIICDIISTFFDDDCTNFSCCVLNENNWIDFSYENNFNNGSNYLLPSLRAPPQI
ncbi:hypothetical protein ACFL6G_01095 [candidate division KSB1 bacterium]